MVSERGTQPGALIVRSGGRVERRLPLIDAAAGQVPATAVAALRAASGVRSLTVDRPTRSAATSRATASPPSTGHGTHMAGIVAGRDDSGLGTGVAPGSRVVNVKVADHLGGTSLISLLAGIDWAVRAG